MTKLILICRRLVAVGALLIVSQTAWAQADSSLAKAKALVDGRQAQAAYEMLTPELDRRAGDPAFDYVLALAALDSGHVSQGVFALERVLAVEPGHPQARAELARAYLLLGELGAARTEFEAVKASNPPPEVEDTIDRYLAEIERRQGGPQGTKLRGFVAFSMGYDSNVNSAQDASTLNVPAFAVRSATGDGTVQINNSGIEQSDAFGQLSAGGNLFHRLGRQLALLSNVGISLRWNDDLDQYDTADGRVDLGLTWQREANVFSVALQANRFLLDKDQFRDAYGIFGQWRRKLDSSTSTVLFGQASLLDYDRQRIRNANRYTVGGVYSKVLGGTYNATLNLGLSGGIEEEHASNVDHLGHRFYGANASLRLEFSPKLSGFVNGALQKRRYGGTDPFFLVQRSDTFAQVGAGVTYEFARHWNVTPQATYSRNNSNVALNEYERGFVSLTLRREFQ
ncbi:MAG: tetratricopeptide (TPR) repeat protein [Gammaproteobacteria bacterium]|jgi:tetratricopeptide (TPR) repeat protein